MNLITIFKKYPDQESCIEHLETVRWGDNPACPHCKSADVARKGELDKVGRWNCHACKSSFNVLSGTIMQGTQVPLQKWFLAIHLMLSAKKSLSSYQLSRDLDLNQKTAWYMQTRIRVAMVDLERHLLQGIIEADETYLGGKPRKGNRREDDKPAKKGRGTDKRLIVGAVERGGRVVAQTGTSLSGKALLKFIKDNVEPAGSLLMTDEWKGYNGVKNFMQHAVINHSTAYVEGSTHTNTIEGFWSLLKRAWYGSHHHYSIFYTLLYLAEACWKYNERKNVDPFSTFIRGCFA